MPVFRQGIRNTEKLSHSPRTTQADTEQVNWWRDHGARRENALLLPGVQVRPRRNAAQRIRGTRLGWRRRTEAAPSLLSTAKVGPPEAPITARLPLHAPRSSPALSSPGCSLLPLTSLRSPLRTSPQAGAEPSVASSGSGPCPRGRVGDSNPAPTHPHPLLPEPTSCSRGKGRGQGLGGRGREGQGRSLAGGGGLREKAGARAGPGCPGNRTN